MRTREKAATDESKKATKQWREVDRIYICSNQLSELLQSKAVVVLIQNEFLRVTPQ